MQYPGQAQVPHGGVSVRIRDILYHKTGMRRFEPFAPGPGRLDTGQDHERVRHMVFWLLAAALVLGSSWFLFRALRREQVGDVSPAAYDLQVYRDQLAEVERDLARGVIGPGDAEQTRTEIARRILAADARLQRDGAGTATTGQTRLLAGLGLLAVLAGGTGLTYWRIGAPDYPDLPLAARHASADKAAAERLTQAAIVAQLPPQDPVTGIPEDFLALVEKLRTTVANRPDDLRGQMLLARNEATLANFDAAARAQERVIALKGDGAGAADYAEYADMMISGARGYVSQEAERALRDALSRDPREPRANYYMGLYFMQIGRPDRTFRVWRELLETSAPDAPWAAPIRSQIATIAEMAGVRYTPPAAAPGPTAEEVQAASQMSGADRQEMIRGMVTQLADRLGSDGGPPEDWARLITAYGVLGETDKAQTVWNEAQEVFAGRDDALARLRGAARQSGLAP